MRRRVPKWRLGSYGLLLGLGLLGASSLSPSPQVALNGLVDDISASEGNHFRYRYKSSNVTFLAGDGWILVLFVGDDDGFAPARYLIVQRRKDVLSAELMIPPKTQYVDSTMTRLKGLPLQNYLDKSGLDLRGLEAVYGRYYAHLKPRKKPG